MPSPKIKKEKMERKEEPKGKESKMDKALDKMKIDKKRKK